MNDVPTNFRVGHAVAGAFAVAKQRHPGVNDRWQKIARTIGPRMPQSLVIGSVVELGNLDVLLRSMEDEAPSKVTSDQEDWVFNVKSMLSDLWIGRGYEVLKLPAARWSQELNDLHYRFRIVRVALEKHRVAGDWSRRDSTSVEMTRLPPQDPDRDRYSYDTKQSARSHIMPRGLSGRGSMMWCASDLEAMQSMWLERRDLSDRLILAWTAASDATIATQPADPSATPAASAQ